MRARIRAVAAVIGLLYPVVPAAAVGSPSCATVRLLGHGWSAARGPLFPTLDAAGFAVQNASRAAVEVLGEDGRTLLVSDGPVVYRSTDAGCTWRTTYSVPGSVVEPEGDDGAPYNVTSILASPSRPKHRQVVFLLLTPNPWLFATPPPDMLVLSRDEGATWQPVRSAPSNDAPLWPNCSSAPRIAAATTATTLFIKCSSAADAVLDAAVGENWFYRSLDGGVSWDAVPGPADADLAPNSLVPGRAAGELWLVGRLVDGSVVSAFHSTNNGAAWQPKRTPVIGDQMMGLQVTPGRGARTTLTVWNEFHVVVSRDAGSHWQQDLHLPRMPDGTPMSVTGAFATSRNVYVFLNSSKFLSAECPQTSTLMRYRGASRNGKRLAVPANWVINHSARGNPVRAARSSRLVLFGDDSFHMTTTGGSCHVEEQWIMSYRPPDGG